MRFRLLLIPFAALALSFAFLACGGDDDDGDDNGGQPTATTDAPTDAPTDADDGNDGDGDNGDGGGNDGGGFGSGTATLTIGDETWEISGIGCVFSAEEARNPSFPFNLSGFGESSTGARAQLSADIYDPSGEERHEGEGVSHHITFGDIDDFENPSVSWTSFNDKFGLYADGAMTELEINGKNISGEAIFDDDTTDAIETVPGTLEVSCP